MSLIIEIESTAHPFKVILPNVKLDKDSFFSVNELQKKRGL